LGFWAIVVEGIVLCVRLSLATVVVEMAEVLAEEMAEELDVVLEDLAAIFFGALSGLTKALTTASALAALNSLTASTCSCSCVLLTPYFSMV
jgi:hypothetical protein